MGTEKLPSDVKISDAYYFPAPPSFWKEMEPPELLYGQKVSDYIRLWFYQGMLVVASVANYEGIEWLHVSFSRRSRMPSYEDMKMVRDHFFGEEHKAIMVFPTKEHYVNLHPYCLHFWYSRDNPMPEFDIDQGRGREI